MGIFNRIKRALGPKERPPADLARWLGQPEAELRQWLSPQPAWTRGFEYKSFTRSKKRGGVRTIDAPNDKLKALQRAVLRRLLNPLKPHIAATGFVRGCSIVDNARPHVGRAVVINLDLEDFFPSIKAARVEAFWRAVGWDAEAARILTAICTLDGALPQGAPTSPALSNLVCRKLDERLFALADHFDGDYTRYADDITLSFPAFGRNQPLRRHSGRPTKGWKSRSEGAVSRRLLTWVRQIIEAEGFKIQLKKKVRVQRAHQRQTATGLLVNEKVNLPRAVRRMIRAMQHHEQLGKLDTAGRRRLRGWEALAQMVADGRG